jgi:primosomal protein N''
VSVELWGPSTATGAELSQAAYFRETLVAQHKAATADLACAREAVRAQTEGSRVVGLRSMARARCTARDLERQVRELASLISALDRRFGEQ